MSHILAVLGLAKRAIVQVVMTVTGQMRTQSGDKMITQSGDNMTTQSGT